MICINDPALKINSISETVLFPDDSSVIISSRNFGDFFISSNMALSHMTKWFSANKSVPNLDATNTMNNSHSVLCISYKVQYTEWMVNTKFLGLQIDNHLSWKHVCWD
jgi:hypothetical protein